MVQPSLHPLHAALLAGTVPLFLGVLLSDLTYSNSYEIQWKNFASWLLVGGLVFGGFTLLWAAIDLARPATGIDESIAREYIERIAQGQPLPADFVRKLFSL